MGRLDQRKTSTGDFRTSVVSLLQTADLKFAGPD